jgi:hypothetical protein
MLDRVFTIRAKRNRASKWEVLDEVDTLEEALQLKEQYRLELNNWLSIIVIIVECRGAKC